jgi:hypothetical protein
MPEVQVHAPSGLKGTVRGLRGEELNLFANQQEAKRRAIGNQILNACWVSTEDMGPAYETADSVDFDKILVCDRFYAMLQIRIATHGPEFIFPSQCVAPACRQRFEWMLDLEKNLDVYDLPPASVEEFRTANRFETQLEDETVYYRLLVGSNEEEAQKAAKMAPSAVATTALTQRVVGVKRPDGVMLSDGNDIAAWAKRLSVSSTLALIDTMDQADGGVETEIEIQCPHCAGIMDVDIPFDSGAFWVPKKSKRSGGRKARRSRPA